MIHRLTRETGPLPEGQEVALGRVEADLLGALLAAEPESLIYACGPAISVWERRFCKARGTTPSPRFLESMLSHLASLGVPREKIKIEAFG